MKIMQLLPTISYGDAIGNHAIVLNKTISEMGYETGIFAENIDKRLPKKIAKHYSKIPNLDKNDIILYHLSTGSDLNYKLSKFKCRKIIIYHNITPPNFFYGYSEDAFKLCSDGLEEAKYLANKIDKCIAVSEFNKKDLVKMGYKNNISILPIIINFNDYAKPYNKEIYTKCKDGYTNIIFTGRIAPNKKQEDVIRDFYYYKKYYNNKSRLIFIGSYDGMERYYNRLKKYVSELEVEDVYFTGHIKFDEILAYYRAADIFLCESEHEGFCVPLVEAMYFNTPIIAYDSTAISDTLGGSGILVKEKNPRLVAGIIDRVINDRALNEQLIIGQKERLKAFDNEKIIEQFEQILIEFIKG